MKEAKRFLPFILTAALVVVDQISKLLVMKYIPLNTIGAQFFGDFLIICHVRNTGVAFSLGAGSSMFVRVLLFVVLPLALMCFMCYLIASRKNLLTNTQKWFVAGIAGGGEHRLGAYAQLFVVIHFPGSFLGSWEFSISRRRL